MEGETFYYNQRIDYISPEGPIRAKELIVTTDPEDDGYTSVPELGIPDKDAAIWEEWRQQAELTALQDALEAAQSGA